MTATNKKSSRSHNNMRPLGITRQPYETFNDNNQKFSLDSYVKKSVPTSSSSSTIDILTSRKSVSTIPAVNPSEDEKKVDHSECIETINELKKQLELSKQENSQLNSDLQKLSTDLSNCQLQNESLTKDNLILKSEREKLSIEKSMLEKNFNDLSNEFVASRDKWLIERNQLEKCLNEIKKELENKIIELRSKHSQEIELLEEKIRVLKIHLADTLNLRSIERQYEIDRISEELRKSQTNEEHLRFRLNKLMDKFDTNSKTNGQQCENCMQSINSNRKKESKNTRKDERNNFEELCVDKSLKSNQLKTGGLNSSHNKH